MPSQTNQKKSEYYQHLLDGMPFTYPYAHGESVQFHARLLPETGTRRGTYTVVSIDNIPSQSFESGDPLYEATTNLVTELTTVKLDAQVTPLEFEDGFGFDVNTVRADAEYGLFYRTFHDGDRFCGFAVDEHLTHRWTGTTLTTRREIREEDNIRRMLQQAEYAFSDPQAPFTSAVVTRKFTSGYYGEPAIPYAWTTKTTLRAKLSQTFAAQLAQYLGGSIESYLGQEFFVDFDSLSIQTSLAPTLNAALLGQVTVTPNMPELLLTLGNTRNGATLLISHQHMCPALHSTVTRNGSVTEWGITMGKNMSLFVSPSFVIGSLDTDQPTGAYICDAGFYRSTKERAFS